MISPELRSAHAEDALQDFRRLEVVYSAELLDTPAEEAFDSLSRLAALLTGAPVSFLSIVDDRRDFYKSQCGFPEPLASARQMSGRTFCHYALASPEPLIISDTHDHPVWRAVPTVDSLGVRAYLGVPLIVDGQPIGSFCVIDNQPRSWTPTEVETLIQVSRSAAREIELRRSLKEAQAEAEHARAIARANEELMAMVAHDLRSPLQVIGLSTTLLTRLVDAPALPHVDRLAGAVDSMKRLVDDLLSTHTARMQGRARRSPISVAKLLTDAIDTMALVADHAGINFSVHPDTTGMVSIDYAQMLRALCNLLGNCVKYCPAGSSVLLQASKGEGCIFISVSDDGPGIREEDQARVFERGWQGNAGLARQDGAGLGLAIVRDLVEQNDGVVSLASELARGTSITIRLPEACDATSPASPGAVSH